MRAVIRRVHDGADLDTGRDTWDVVVDGSVICNYDTRREAKNQRDEFNAIAALCRWGRGDRR